ncbi:MAG: sulfatase family protein [Anaerolineae bacterium]
MRRPNVLLLYTDQQRWDTIAYGAGAYPGNPHIHTPNLDRLAREGALMANAFCNNPVCMPSRQSMLSGRYPSTICCTVNGIEMREDVWTLPRILNSYDYHTANVGKLHFKNHSNRDHREPHPRYGFDTLILSDEPGCYDDAYIKWVEAHDASQVEACRVNTPPAWEGEPVVVHPRNTHEPYVFDGPEHLTHSAFVAEETISYLERRNPERPFFAIAGFYAPHAPLNPPARFVEMYDPDKLPLPHRDEAPDDVPWGGRTLMLTDDHWRKVKAYYYALISHVDDQVGRIIRYLEQSGLRENTLIIFTSDHGEHLGDHGLIQKGPPGLESCAHVPLIVAPPPGTVSGDARVYGELIEAVDIAPTILDYCGVQAPPFFQGRSFRPLLEGGASGRDYEPRRSAYIEFKDPMRSSWKTVRTHAYKYTVFTADGDPASQGELLFDLQDDPHELRNVAADPAYAEALGAMRRELIRRWFTVEDQYPLRTGAY